ncbi:MAG: hypothetical protein K2H09_09800 [Treponemataceae bacterium]|nr:hypothetical protein [Treponemataceae bacterium]
MARDVLEIARKYMRRRRFDKAIAVLESRAEIYEENFNYYQLLATACLYAGDTGSAATYFQRARNIRMTDVNPLVGQAALFLRRGNTDRAILYYLEILDNDPTNKTAKRAMEFIRTKGDFTTICRWVDTGRIERFYPPLGVNPYKVAGWLLPLAACAFGCLLAVRIIPSFRSYYEGARADLTPLELTVNERKNAQETDLASGSYSYILSASQINDAYGKANRYFQQYRDNSAQIEINRILNSNASVAVKQKARMLMNYLEAPTFDTLKDGPSFRQVEREPALYEDCWVSWSGRVSNAVRTESSYSCELLVGYETMEKVEGIVPLHFSVPPVIETDKPVTVLAKVSLEGGRMCLEGRAVYQSVRGVPANDAE